MKICTGRLAVQREQVFLLLEENKKYLKLCEDVKEKTATDFICRQIADVSKKITALERDYLAYDTALGVLQALESGESITLL